MLGKIIGWNFRMSWFIIKWGFHVLTLFIPLILWSIFKTSYEQKLNNIEGIGGGTADLIMSKFPNEESLKNASIEKIEYTGISKDSH